MYLSNAYKARPALFHAVAVVLVSCAFAGCNKEQGAAAPDAAAGAAATQQAAQPAVADKVNAMSADQLRDAAGQALRQQRLYAPGGDNAMEYYLALRDKQPNDPAVSSALTDLMPYALIATEQSIARDDFSEAQRLYALMEKTDAKAPALPRLKQSIADGQAAAAKKAQDQQLAAADEVKRQAEIEKQRIADQQKQQKEATEKLAQQQAAAPPPAPAPVQRPVQQAAPPPPAPIELSTNVEYPNGLADPQENFARADNDRDGGGFPWGLLGLLGLLGLVPWLRGGPKTIYVEREKPGQDPNRPRE
jgi:protein TonB